MKSAICVNTTYICSLHYLFESAPRNFLLQGMYLVRQLDPYSVKLNQYIVVRHGKFQEC